MKQDVIYAKLKEQGFRLTNQRKLIIDIILENECACCKEIYYKALKVNPKIGIATIYRMMKTLEDIGAINPQKVFQIDAECFRKDETRILLHDCKEVVALKEENWFRELKYYLRKNGYLNNEDISVHIQKTCGQKEAL